MSAKTVEAFKIYEEAREHKRLSGFHRNQAKSAMQRLEKFCKQHGIKLEVVTGDGHRHQAKEIRQEARKETSR